jgi:mono/diheme cytochrome c family protein
VSGRDVALGLFALVLVVFSLVVSLLIPRRDPGFPGRNLRVFVVVAVLLVAAMLTAVEVFGESHEEEGEGGQAAETQEGGAGGAGDPEAGRLLFVDTGCDTCHTLEDAGSTAEIGPNLDESLQGDDAAFVRESIVEPDATVTEGFSADLMPETYGEQLSEEELANLAAYLVQATGGA